jgi:hypothetical protein
MKHPRPHGKEHSPLIVGVILLVIGAGLLAAKLGFTVPEDLWRHWPFVLVVPGLIGTFLPTRHLSRSGGVWLLATGIYGLCGMYEPWGLSWGGAWPIFIIAAGFGVIFDKRQPRSDMDAIGRLRERMSDRASHDE